MEYDPFPKGIKKIKGEKDLRILKESETFDLNESINPENSEISVTAPCLVNKNKLNQILRKLSSEEIGKYVKALKKSENKEKRS